MGNRLRKLKALRGEKKLSDGKTIGRKGRLTDAIISKLTTFYGNAIRANSHNVNEMRQAVWAVWAHTSSTDDEPKHWFCPTGKNSWCKYNVSVHNNTVNEFSHKNTLPKAVSEVIKTVFKDLSHLKLLRRCLGGKTQNANESLNSLIWKYSPKLIGLGINVTKIAACEYNDGNDVEEDVKIVLDSIVKDHIRTEEKEEKLRQEREYEVEKLQIQDEKNADTMNNSENVQAPKMIHETFHKCSVKDDISLNLTLFERHAELTFLPKKDWVQKLIGLIPFDIAHLIAREPADKCNDYNHVKRLLLKRFKLSPEKLRQLFISHRKSNERTWQDFFYEIQTYFDGWIFGLNVETFDQLRELIIADQIKKSAPCEFQEHFLEE
ncbi:peptidase A2 domain-containing protein [Trichonephila clavipes]|uniref:Peptidase A2 domain-containing protein n=1 Tax=Trichonephila clavipes TaxID=2585209 RepID=A0A8X6RLZ5_TRICX|nr:peptidase A2 domain-containing protein [Trichonephila clavipes]